MGAADQGERHQRGLTAQGMSTVVVPAQAGTHIPETVVMGPRFRGDDTGENQRSRQALLQREEPRPRVLLQHIEPLAQVVDPEVIGADRLR